MISDKSYYLFFFVVVFFFFHLIRHYEKLSEQKDFNFSDSGCHAKPHIKISQRHDKNVSRENKTLTLFKLIDKIRVCFISLYISFYCLSTSQISQKQELISVESCLLTT